MLVFLVTEVAWSLPIQNLCSNIMIVWILFQIRLWAHLGSNIHKLSSNHRLSPLHWLRVAEADCRISDLVLMHVCSKFCWVLLWVDALVACNICVQHNNLPQATGCCLKDLNSFWLCDHRQQDAGCWVFVFLGFGTHFRPSLEPKPINSHTDFCRSRVGYGSQFYRSLKTLKDQ